MPTNIKKILKKIETPVQEYCNTIFPEYWNYIEKEKKKYNKFLNRLFDFYLFSSYLVDSGLFKDRPDYDYPLTVIYSNAAINYFGSYKCLESGCISESAILSRSLFETTVNLKLILEKDTEMRLQLYQDYKYVSKWLNLKNAKNNYSDIEQK